MSNEHKADKGKKGGRCNRTACQKPGAEWYNHATEAYYCASCAHEINRVNPEAQKMYGHPLCTREQPQEGKPLTSESIEFYKQSLRLGITHGIADGGSRQNSIEMVIKLCEAAQQTASLREELEKVKKERNRTLDDYSSLQFSSVQDKRRHLKELEAVKKENEEWKARNLEYSYQVAVKSCVMLRDQLAEMKRQRDELYNFCEIAAFRHVPIKDEWQERYSKCKKRLSSGETKPVNKCWENDQPKPCTELEIKAGQCACNPNHPEIPDSSKLVSPWISVESGFPPQDTAFNKFNRSIRVVVQDQAGSVSIASVGLDSHRWYVDTWHFGKVIRWTEIPKL